jgi:hypothetical protein
MHLELVSEGNPSVIAVYLINTRLTGSFCRIFCPIRLEEVTGCIADLDLASCSFGFILLFKTVPWFRY